MRRTAIVVFAALCLLALTATGRAYPVAYALSLEDLIKQADVVCKAVAAATEPVEDEWFGEVHGFRACATHLKVVSVFKGTIAEEKIAFRHYGKDKDGMGMMYMPQYYEFTRGRTYIVFAKKTDNPGIYCQLWKSHRTKEDQGLLLAADEEPHKGMSVKDLFWTELTALLNGDDIEDVVYAIEQLDQMSGASHDGLDDFDRRRVLKVVQPLIHDQRDGVARRSIGALGSENPYMSTGSASFWLATVGGGHFPGLGKWDLEKEYLGGKLYWRQLASVADKDSRLELRAAAIRALGRSMQPEVLDLARRWIRSPEPEIRAAATVLLADYPGKESEDELKALADDHSPTVRRSAAHAVGFGQFSRLVPVLRRRLHDSDTQVSSAAALSLLSFSLDHSREALEANVDHAQYRPLFVNALAREAPERYLDELAEVIRLDLVPENWWGGFVPWGVSWNILFKYAESQPAARLREGQLDKVLDALEAPISDDPKSPKYYSSSEPRDLYALYLQRGLTERARKFRAACRKAVSYDIDYYFNMVDKNPSTYQRQ